LQVLKIYPFFPLFSTFIERRVTNWHAFLFSVPLHRAQDSEEQLLPILFDVPAEGKGEFMTTAQISERLVTYGNIKKPMSVSRLGMLLGTAGYQPVRPKVAGRLVRGWLVYQRDTEEIATLKRLLKE
jgi:hypothetical protein